MSGFLVFHCFSGLNRAHSLWAQVQLFYFTSQFFSKKNSTRDISMFFQFHIPIVQWFWMTFYPFPMSHICVVRCSIGISLNFPFHWWNNAPAAVSVCLPVFSLFPSSNKLAGISLLAIIVPWILVFLKSQMSHIVTALVVIVLIYSMVPQIYMGPNTEKVGFSNFLSSPV